MHYPMNTEEGREMSCEDIKYTLLRKRDSVGIRDQVIGVFPSILTEAELPLEMAMLTSTNN